MIQITSFALTDTGRVRDRNEDGFLANDSKLLYIVADGMGGANAGKLASSLVVEVLPKLIFSLEEKTPKPSVNTKKRIIVQSIQSLCAIVQEYSSGQIGLHGMGSTVVLLYFFNGKAVVASLGDSRCYLLRNKRIRMISTDHTVTALLLKNHELSRSEAKKHPSRSRLTRYIGMEQEANPFVRSLKVRHGDRFLLCSDGLTDMLSVPAIRKTMLNQQTSLQDTANSLMKQALDLGGKDNVTILLTDIALDSK